MKVQKQFLASVLFVSMLFFFGCEVEPEDTDPGDKWVDVTNLSQASGTWKMAFEREYSDTPVIMGQVEYILDIYINLTTLRMVVAFVGDDVANSWEKIKTDESAAGGNIVFNDTDHSGTMTADINLDNFEIKRSGDKLKIRSRGSESEIELSKISADWSSISTWTEITGVWKGDISPEMVEMFEIVEMSDTPEMSETSEMPEMPEMPEVPVRYEIKLDVTVGGPTVMLITTMDFGSEFPNELWALMKMYFSEGAGYEVNDEEHTVSMVTIIEEPLTIGDCEIHVDKKKLKLQNGEMAIILFKEEPAGP